MEVSPPGGVLLRRAPGTAAFDFGQEVLLSPCWTAPGGAKPGRRRTSLQHGAKAPAAGAAGAAGGAAPLVIHSESLAWACSLPDPAAAIEYLQRAALLGKAAGAGALVGQPAENCGSVLPCGFR